MPRKKTLDQTVSSIEVKAKKPTTTKKKIAAPEPESLISELSGVLGDDVSLVFRAKQPTSDAPARAVRGRSTPAQSPTTAQKVTKTAPPIAAEVEPDTTNWDEELPVPSFRTRTEQAPRPRNTSLAPSLEPTSPPTPRPARGRKPRREEVSVETEVWETERPNRRDEEVSNPAREFEPTAILEKRIHE